MMGIDASAISALIESSPGVAVAGAMYFVWRREAKSREKAEALAEEAEKRLIAELTGQIATWKHMKELADAH